MSKYTDWALSTAKAKSYASATTATTRNALSLMKDTPIIRKPKKELRSMGWVSRKIDGEWYDFCCQECVNEYYQKSRKKRG